MYVTGLTHALALCFVALLPSAASAEARTSGLGASLGWVRLEGAETCISPTDLAAQIESKLAQRQLVSPAEALLNVEGTIRPRVRGGFEAQVRISDRDGRVLGSRSVSSSASDCRELDGAVLLIIVLTLQGGTASGAPGGIALPEDVRALMDALFADEGSLDMPWHVGPDYSASLNLRCIEHTDHLYEPSRYIEGFRSLRPNNDHVIFAAIAGVPTELVSPAFRADFDFADPDQVAAYYEAVLADPDMMPRADREARAAR